MPFPHTFASLAGGQYPAAYLDDDFSFLGDVASDTGAVNAYAATVSLATLTAGQRVVLQNISATNTGASTLNVNSTGALPIHSIAGIDIAAGNLITGTVAEFILNSAQTAWILISDNTSSSPVGESRNLAASLATAGTSLTFTADELTVASALGGSRFILSGLNATINVATTGAGGMDTGTAPVSGYVGIYAIYNPGTGAAALLGVDATSAKTPEIYGGANMPPGYTASALVSVWPTNASGQFIIGSQSGRAFYFVAIESASLQASSQLVPVNVSTVIPKNAKSTGGQIQVIGTGLSFFVAGDASGTGEFQVSGPAASTLSCSFTDLVIITPQTIYAAQSGTGSSAMLLSSYKI